MVKKSETQEISNTTHIKSLEDLKEYLKTNKLNPMERVMATNLLLNSWTFYPQYKVNIPHGWTVSGKKYFITDFYVPEINLIIETDGKLHKEIWEQDLIRQNTLACMGYRIFRFTWDDVMENRGEEFSVFSFLNQLVIYEMKLIEEKFKEPDQAGKS